MLKNSILNVKYFLRKVAFKYVLKKSKHSLCNRFNFLNGKLFGSPVRLNWDQKNAHYIITERLRSGENISIHNSRKERLSLYFNGVKYRVDSLASKYFIPELNVNDDDVVIDCGANVGEIGKHFQVNNITPSYHAFDPSKREYESSRLNNPQGIINQKGLWKETDTLTLFEKNKTADSSFIEMSGYQNKVDIDVVALDDYVLQEGIEKIKLLKLEAEGAEPEILEGAKKILHRIEWVSADCGPERGTAKEMTFKFVINFLIDNGFRVEALNPKKSIILLRNSVNN